MGARAAVRRGAARARASARATRSALLLPNTPHFPLAYFGTLALGAVAVPVHALLKAEEIEYVLQDSGAKALVCAAPLLGEGAKGAELAGVPVLAVMDGGDATHRAHRHAGPAATPIEALVPREPDDTAVILYTSGTTGKPKGAEITHLNVHDERRRVGACTRFDIGRGRRRARLPAAVPHLRPDLLHEHRVLRRRHASCCCRASTARRRCELLVEEKCTIFMGVPTMYVGLLEAAKTSRPAAEAEDARCPAARRCRSPVLEKFAEVFGTQVLEGYGLTETSPVATFNQVGFEPRPGTVGKPIWGVEVEVAKAELDERIELLPTGELGEIVVRGHNVFKGYLNKPEATAAAIVDGWFRTGDLGTKDAEGYVTIVDRKKDMVIRGGYNVYPREVEEVLLRHPAVGQVAVIGLPDPQYGEEVCAVVVADPAAARSPRQELSAWAKEQLAALQVPAPRDLHRRVPARAVRQGAQARAA